MKFCGIFVVAAAALVWAGGCDDGDDGISPEVIAERERQQRQLQELARTPPLPTTQELMSGARKSIRLADYPLTLRVPQSWELKSWGDGQIFLVAGPASSGEINLQFTNPMSSRPVLDVALGEAIKKAKAEADAKAHPFNKVEMRDLNDGAKVLEERMISTRFVDGKLPPEQMGEVEVGPGLTTRGVVNPHMMKWTFTVFIPEGEGKYQTRALNFMGLQMSEFARDREFLERLMGTLKYEK
jgi:hypothetical protein